MATKSMTNEAKHTPGLWHMEIWASKTSKDGRAVVIGDGMVLTDFEHAADPRQAANARLVAAAPALLAALQNAATGLHYLMTLEAAPTAQARSRARDHYSAAIAAIAQATSKKE